MQVKGSLTLLIGQSDSWLKDLLWLVPGILPDPLLEGVRFWSVKGFPKYVIFFRIHEQKVVEVMRVLHSARNLESLLPLALDDK